MKKALVLILVVTSALLVGHGCNENSPVSPQPSPNTLAENPLREKNGLRTVKPAWHLYRVEFDAEDWQVTKDSGPTKRIQRDAKRNPLWEEDYYYSGGTYKTVNGGTDWESITVHYEYGPGSLEVHYIGESSAIRAAFDALKEKASTPAEKLAVVDDALRACGQSRVE